MHFLIDMENVLMRGVEGCELLEKNDTIVFFYSSYSWKVPSAALSIIQAKGCKIEGYNLVNAGKNALDFYLVSYLSRICAENKDIQEIAIVSKDNGYKAVRDFYDNYVDQKVHIILGTDITDCISKMNGEEGNRRKNAMPCYHTEDLRLYFKHVRKEAQKAAAEEKKKAEEIKPDEEVVLVNMDTKREQLNEFIADKDMPLSTLYHKILHLYGIQEGTKVYRRIRAARNVAAQYNEARAV